MNLVIDGHHGWMDVGGRSEFPATAPAAGGVVCGLLTAGAIGTVLGFLDDYQVHDFADSDPMAGLSVTAVAVIVVAFLIAVGGRIGGRRLSLRRPNWHALAVVVLVPAAVAPLVLGAERNRLEAGVIWGAAAISVQVMLAYVAAGVRWRRWVAAGLVLPCAAAPLIVWGCQHRWRSQKFEAVGLPLVVPEVPGYRLAGTWAGRYSVSMALRDASGHRLHSVIEPASSPSADCEPESHRLVPGAELVTERAVFCLRGGAELTLIPGDGLAGVARLLPGVTIREVDGSVLADQPDDSTMSEPD